MYRVRVGRKVLTETSFRAIYKIIEIIGIFYIFRTTIYKMASNLWVAVGSGGTGNRIVTSADGTTWTNTGSTVIDPKAVAYKNNLWVAVGRTGNSIATSTDGVLWTGRGITMFSTGSGYCVAFGNNLWVAGGYGGANSIATSADGITWTSRTSMGCCWWYSSSR